MTQQFYLSQKHQTQAPPQTNNKPSICFHEQIFPIDQLHTATQIWYRKFIHFCSSKTFVHYIEQLNYEIQCQQIYPCSTSDVCGALDSMIFKFHRKHIFEANHTKITPTKIHDSMVSYLNCTSTLSVWQFLCHS